MLRNILLVVYQVPGTNIPFVYLHYFAKKLYWIQVPSRETVLKQLYHTTVRCYFIKHCLPRRLLELYFLCEDMRRFYTLCILSPSSETYVESRSVRFGT